MRGRIGRSLHAGIIVAVVIAGCARQPPVQSDPEPEPPLYDGALVELNLSVVGGPIDASGLVERGLAIIAVSSGGESVSFNDESIAQEEGDHTRLELPANEATLPLYLHSGQAYDFEVHSYDENDELLGYGQAARTAVDGGSNAAVVTLSGVMGELIMHPRYPTNKVLPGQVIDLMTSVSANARPDLRLAQSDLQAEYSVQNGTVIAGSSRGVQLRAGDRAGGDLVVLATAAGFVQEGDTVRPGELNATVRLPFSTDVSVDLTNPTVSTLAFDSAQQIFTGIADDDFGVASLDIYDGPNHLATTNSHLAEQHGLQEVEFPGGGTAFISQLALPPAHYTLTAVVTDTSGNHAEKSIVVAVP